ncbi:MAG: response regulator [Anaerolineales bacterium]|nr:response regulator [Anaerolineales bacterium]
MSTQKHVLVIDDEVVVREAVEDILESIDIVVISAGDGREGIALFQAHRDKISGILLDMKMPGLSGPDTLRELRQLDPHIPVILSSGYSEDETKKAIADQGPAIFLPKPYNFEELIAKVEELLRLDDDETDDE